LTGYCHLVANCFEDEFHLLKLWGSLSSHFASENLILSRARQTLFDSMMKLQSARPPSLCSCKLEMAYEALNMRLHSMGLSTWICFQLNWCVAVAEEVPLLLKSLEDTVGAQHWQQEVVSLAAGGCLTGLPTSVLGYEGNRPNGAFSKFGFVAAGGGFVEPELVLLWLFS